MPPVDELRTKLFSAALTVPPPGRGEASGGACTLPGCSVPELLDGEELDVDPGGAEVAGHVLSPCSAVLSLCLACAFRLCLAST